MFISVIPLYLYLSKIQAFYSSQQMLVPVYY
jgi:hypothetical protein